MLTELLRQKIQQDGSLSLYDYMALCLYAPQVGYYMRQVPMGAEGDFITAPEISQLFGELIGGYLLSYGIAQNAPINLVECGPGKGTLMQDMLKVFQLRPKLEKHVKLLEISPALKACQRQTLQGHSVDWYTELETLLEDAAPHPLLLVANEFLDALPIHQYTHVEEAWHQRHVIWENNGFSFCWKPCQVVPCHWPKTSDIYEHAPDGPLILGQITDYLKQYGGMAVFIDYGYIHGTGDTLQGMRNHKYDLVLEKPGQTDLTSHVNFSLLKELAEAQGCMATILSQNMFLSQLGIHARAQQLSNTATPEMQAKLHQQVRYLTEKMGDLFKVLVVQNPA